MTLREFERDSLNAFLEGCADRGLFDDCTLDLREWYQG